MEAFIPQLLPNNKDIFIKKSAIYLHSFNRKFRSKDLKMFIESCDEKYINDKEMVDLHLEPLFSIYFNDSDFNSSSSYKCISELFYLFWNNREHWDTMFTLFDRSIQDYEYEKLNGIY